MNLNFLSPFNSLGYGIFGKNILKELDKRCNVSYFPIGQIEILNDDDTNLVKKTISQSEQYDAKAVSIRLWHPNDLAQHVGAKKIGFIVFELDNFSKREIHHIESQDAIFVCSKWARDIILEKTRQLNVHVVSGGVDTNIFKPVDFSKRDTYVFLTIGKFEVRKNHQGIIDAFSLAFQNETNVELWLACSNPFLSSEDLTIWQNYINKSKLANKIKLVPHLQTQEELCRIINISDCGVQVSRAEGFDLPNLELFAASKPVISSNYSAHTEYCNDKNSTLVPIYKTELANAANYGLSTQFDRTHFYGQGNWGVINTDDVVSAMRLEFSRGKRDNPYGLETAQFYGWDRTARKILENL